MKLKIKIVILFYCKKIKRRQNVQNNLRLQTIKLLRMQKIQNQQQIKYFSLNQQQVNR
jgi:hypothetical protein